MIAGHSDPQALKAAVEGIVAKRVATAEKQSQEEEAVAAEAAPNTARDDEQREKAAVSEAELESRKEQERAAAAELESSKQRERAAEAEAELERSKERERTVAAELEKGKQRERALAAELESSKQREKEALEHKVPGAAAKNALPPLDASRDAAHTHTHTTTATTTTYNNHTTTNTSTTDVEKDVSSYPSTSGADQGSLTLQAHGWRPENLSGHKRHENPCVGERRCLQTGWEGRGKGGTPQEAPQRPPPSPPVASPASSSPPPPSTTASPAAPAPPPPNLTFTEDCDAFDDLDAWFDCEDQKRMCLKKGVAGACNGAPQKPPPPLPPPPPPTPPPPISAPTSTGWYEGNEGEAAQDQKEREEAEAAEHEMAKGEMEEAKAAEGQMHDAWKAFTDIADAAIHAYQRPAPAAAPAAAPAGEASTEAVTSEQMEKAVTSAVNGLYKRLAAKQGASAAVVPRDNSARPVVQPEIPARAETSVDGKTAWWKWMDSMAQRRHMEQETEEDEEVLKMCSV